MHVERQVVTASGNLRVQYLRDREHGIRRIALQDTKNPSNSVVLTDYKKNVWAVVSPDDQWVALNSRGTEAGAQLYHRVSATPLKYEVPADLRTAGGSFQDVVWQSYLSDTQQGANTDRRGVTIDATAWAPDSHKLVVAVSPMATEGDTAPPMPWSCTYDVTTKQVEPVPEVADNSPNEPQNTTPDDQAKASPNETAAADAANQNAPATETYEQSTTAADDSEMEGERFPATRQQVITVPDVNELPLSDIRYAINEMFARHGANFHDADLKKNFSQFSWYHPREGVSFEDVEQDFSDIERQNIAVLRRCRDAKIAAAHRVRSHAVKGEKVEEESEGHRFWRNVLQDVQDQLNNQQP